MEIRSLFCAEIAATISCHALRHGPLLLLQSDAYYEAHAPSQCERDAPPSRDGRLRDVWPLLRGVEQHAYDVPLTSYDVLQLSLTWGFLQMEFSASRVSEIHR